MMNRRVILTGLTSLLIPSPALVRASSLDLVKGYILDPEVVAFRRNFNVFRPVIDIVRSQFDGPDAFGSYFDGTRTGFPYIDMVNLRTMTARQRVRYLNWIKPYDDNIIYEVMRESDITD